MPLDDKTHVRGYYERLWNAHDLTAIDEVCHPDLTDHWHQQTGRDAWRATAADLQRTFPDLRFDVTLQLAEEGTVATHWSMQGTDRGGLFRMAPTGRRATFTGVFIDRLEERRIVEHWAVTDMWRILRHLEVVPASWQADTRLVAADADG